MTFKLIFVFKWYFLLVVGSLIDLASCLDCFDTYFCALATITNQSDKINCFGYKSCFESQYIKSLHVYCMGSYSCSNSRYITTNGNYIDCRGLKSCFSVDFIELASLNWVSYFRCFGEQSCTNSNIFISGVNQHKQNNLRCEGFLSCANTTITLSGPQIATIVFGGYLSGQNTTCKTANNSGVVFYFYGRNSGYQARIICGMNHSCNVVCRTNGCNNLTLSCENSEYFNYNEDGDECSFDIDCDAAENSTLRPNGFDNWEVIVLNYEYNYYFNINDSQYVSIQ